MKIDHGNLRALAAVVREGSFERAALALSVTPSAVSQRIKALEDRMGRLLVQRTVPAAATTDGQVLVQLAEQTALLEHDALNRLGVADDDVPHASIPIAVNHDSLETWFVDAALQFSSRTRATLDMQSEDQDHTAALLRNGAVLGAVTTLADPVQATVPIIALTGRSRADDAERYAAIGIDGVLPKPIDPDRIFSTVLCWLQRRASELG